MNNAPSFVSPLAPAKRIQSIDLLRGIAVLGILIMNIQSFSMPGAAYLNPIAYGDLSGINKWVWILSHGLSSEKFMSIFSLLFGAGILLFTGKAHDRGHREGPLHYRRMLWLFIFGMIHAYLIWYGDILVAYSLCGMLAFVFRKRSPHRMIGISIVFFMIPILFYTMSYISIPYWPEESVNQTMLSWKPPADAILREVAAMQGNWMQQMEYRVPGSIFMQTWLFLMETFWRVMSMILLGMALFKWDVISAQRSIRFYIRLTFWGLVPGLALSALGVWLNFDQGWAMDTGMFLNRQLNYVGSVGVALGYIGIVMLISKSHAWQRFKQWFRAVGRMAFSNYILQSIICTLIFYGHGLGLYGEMERKFQILTVFGVWIIVIVFSVIWLRNYRFGPLERLWRSLTYWRRMV